MTERVPHGIDVTVPNVARIYDYFLGGKDNFAADRAAADQITAMMPLVPTIARDNRAFVCRVVRVLAGEYGIRQFIDVGAGLPTQQSVHTVANEALPGSRVVYVDNDLVVCSHGRALLEGESSVMVEADLREPEQIIDDPLTRSLIDFTEPFALLLTAVLHFVPDADDPRGIIGRFRQAMAPGSFLVLSHGTIENDPGDQRVQLSAQVYSRTSVSLSLRPLNAVRELFDGFGFIEPGLVWISQWRPDPTEHTDAATETLRGGVGRLPGHP